MNSSVASSFGSTVLLPAWPSGDQGGRGYCNGFCSGFFFLPLSPADELPAGVACGEGAGRGCGVAWGAGFVARPCAGPKKKSRSDSTSVSFCSAFGGGASPSPGGEHTPEPQSR